MAGFILHNICMRMHDHLQEEVVVVHEDVDEVVEDDHPNAQEVRDRVAQYVWLGR